MTLLFDGQTTQDLEETARREWLETNGLGGWASSTISGAHTRRYHGLLVAAMRPPTGRIVLLSKLDETIVTTDGRYDLGCNFYSGAVHPRGYQYLQQFAKDLFPGLQYNAGGICIEKTVVAVHGENTTLLLYKVQAVGAPFSLELRPLVAGRDYHSLVHANDVICRETRFEGGVLCVRPYDGVPKVFISVPDATFEAAPDWYLNFQYAREQERGLDYREDLFCYGVFHRRLEAGQTLAVIISIEDPTGRDALELYRKEEHRRQDLLRSVSPEDTLFTTLTLAADQFVVRCDRSLRTIIAGYHWFTDWGRDTMIALSGITLVTGRYEDAQKILRAFAERVSEGMLPNRYPEEGEVGEYNTVDATLWFFVAIEKYLQYTQDEAFVRDELMPLLQEIIRWHDHGTRYNIHVDTDGLLYAGAPGVQLTWMDAKIGNSVVTPRQGKAVEVNALWYNALRILAHLSTRFHELDAGLEYEKHADCVKTRFTGPFWNHENQCLYDCIDGDHREDAIRPNQIFAISLPYPLLSGERAASVLRIVEEKLLTPYGLRSLAPDNPDYHPQYLGDTVSRDSAYHQGTVWAWLLGPYISALVRIRGSAGREQARTILTRMATHFSDAGVGTISEIFDAAAPHSARGCIAQAWSVSEILRAYVEDGFERALVR